MFYGYKYPDAQINGQPVQIKINFSICSAKKKAEILPFVTA